MQEDAVLVLFDVRGHFEKREDHGGGLGRGQGRVGERVGAKRMMQDIRPARQQEPCGIGEKGCGRRTIAVEVILHRLDIVFAIAAGTVQVFIHVLRCRRLSGRHDKPRVVARSHDFRLDDDAPGLLP